MNNTGYLTLSNRRFICNLSNIQLKMIRRDEKKCSESVMDEKFAICFQIKLNFSNTSLNIHTLSLPVVVIVHGNQETQSLATITWDNAFSEIDRKPFYVVDRVPWSMLSTVLSTKFKSQTQRELTELNMSVLC